MELGGNTCTVWLEWDPDAVHSTTLLITLLVTWQEVQRQAGTTAENAQGLLGRATEVPKETLSSSLCGGGQAVGLLAESGGIALNLA